MLNSTGRDGAAKPTEVDLEVVVERTLSAYLFGLAGIASLTVISPMIIFSVPLLLLVGPLTGVWWHRRADRAELRGLFRFALVAVASFLFAIAMTAVVWAVAAGYRGTEAVVVAAIALVFLPFVVAAMAFAVWGPRRPNDEG